MAEDIQTFLLKMEAQKEISEQKIKNSAKGGEEELIATGRADQFYYLIHCVNEKQLDLGRLMELSFLCQDEMTRVRDYPGNRTQEVLLDYQGRLAACDWMIDELVSVLY